MYKTTTQYNIIELALAARRMGYKFVVPILTINVTIYLYMFMDKLGNPSKVFSGFLRLSLNGSI